ncbi:MAG: biopolymer transporter ExbD, partial [Kiritimatiellae bacterium]|nr:biopolymer transporter ExbD [Kiritimatiellia bacterium]
SRRKRKPRQVNGEINMTPILDMTFLLLIAFIITFPALQGGITVQLPKASGDPLPNNEPFAVNVTAEGKIFVGKDPVSDEELLLRAQEAVAKNKDVAAHIRGDETQAYGRIMDVIKILRRAKLTKFSLVTENE